MSFKFVYQLLGHWIHYGFIRRLYNCDLNLKLHILGDVVYMNHNMSFGTDKIKEFWLANVRSKRHFSFFCFFVLFFAKFFAFWIKHCDSRWNYLSIVFWCIIFFIAFSLLTVIFHGFDTICLGWMTQGLGVVWNKEEGFVEDDFVVDFLGEVLLNGNTPMKLSSLII